ncbi:MAG: hypothetical protein AB7F20_15525 [Geoalkalibacter sp.]
MAEAVVGLAAGSAVAGFESLLRQDFIPVSLSFKRDNSGPSPPPY